MQVNVKLSWVEISGRRVGRIDGHARENKLQRNTYEDGTDRNALSWLFLVAVYFTIAWR